MVLPSAAAALATTDCGTPLKYTSGTGAGAGVVVVVLEDDADLEAAAAVALAVPLPLAKTGMENTIAPANTNAINFFIGDSSFLSAAAEY